MSLDELMADLNLQQEALQDVAARGLRDFHYFATEILCLDGREGTCDFTDPAYKPTFEASEAWLTMDGLGLMPRGTGKSTLWTQARALWLGLRNPNTRIALASGKFDNACDMVGVIRRWMLFHPKLREVYGPLGYLPQDKNWGTASSLRFPLRTANYMEDTIEAIGADQQVTSRHYDLVLGDDLVNKETANTPEQLANTEKWWGLTKGLLVTGGIRILIGTRWHFYDIYGTTLRKEEERREKGMKPRVHVCRLQARVPRENGEYDQTCAPRFKHKTEEKLREDLEDLGPTLYAGQIDLEPLPEGTALIKESDLRKAFYRLDHVMERDHENRLRVKAGFDVSITVDFAASLDPKADRTAILVWATDMDGDIYLLDSAVGRMMPSEAIARIAAFRNRYNALWMGTEEGVLKAIYKSALIEWTRDHPNQRPLFFSKIETGGGKGTSRDRCLAIEPYVLAGKLHLLVSQVDIMQELCTYPMGRYRDAVDATAFKVLNPRRPNQKRTRKDEKDLTTQEKCHAIAMRGNRDYEYANE